MRVAVGVVAHEQRKQQALELADRARAAHVSFDNGDIGCDQNHQQAWRQLACTDTDWSIVLEDDAVIDDNFTSHARAALTHAPRNIVSFYLGTARPPHWQTRISDALDKAHANDAAWIVSTHLLHAVAVAIRAPLVPAMLEHVARRRYLPIDEAIGQWARTLRQSTTERPIAYTVPSLVDHSDLPTLAQHPDHQPRTQPRHAWQYGPARTYDTNSVTM